MYLCIKYELMLSKYHADLTCLAIIVIPLLHGILDMTRILLHICRHAQQPVRPQRSREQVQHVPADHPALQIPGDVGPWVREEDADLAQARCGDVPFEEHGGIGANQPNILEPLSLSLSFAWPVAGRRVVTGGNIVRGRGVDCSAVRTYCVTVMV